MKNRKIIWMIGMLLALGITGYTQQIRYGIEAGFDVANAQLTNKSLIQNTRINYPLCAFNLNGYIGMKRSERWGVALEPGFIQKGSVTKGDYADSQIRMNCIQLPILAEWYLTDKLFLSAGPELSYMLNAKAYTDGDKNDVSELFDNQLELSGLFGVNYRITSHFDIALRYNHGITGTRNITLTDEQGEPICDMKLYNQYFQVMARYRL